MDNGISQCVCVCVCVFVCVSGDGWVGVLSPLLFLSREGRLGTLRFEFKTEQADFTDWMSSMPFNFTEEISPNLVTTQI